MLNLYSPFFQVATLDGDIVQTHVETPGVLTMIAKVVEMSATGHAVSIRVGGVDAGAPRAATSPIVKNDWSLWAFAHGRWNWSVIGALSLDDMGDSLFGLINSSQALEELRICPPGSVNPLTLT